MTSATSASTSYVYRTVVLSVCPVYGCLDLTLVCCCQTVRWIEMKLDKEILNSTQLNEHLWTQVIKHLDVHIYLDRLRPWPHCVRWKPSSPQRGTTPDFRPTSVVAK